MLMDLLIKFRLLFDFTFQNFLVNLKPHFDQKVFELIFTEIRYWEVRKNKWKDPMDDIKSFQEIYYGKLTFIKKINN